MKFPVQILSKGQTKYVLCRRGEELSVSEEVGIVVWNIVSSSLMEELRFWRDQNSGVLMFPYVISLLPEGLGVFEKTWKISGLC